MKRPPPSSLALTRPLLRWLAADPAWPDLPATWRAAARWRAAWGSVNIALSRSTAHGGGVALPDPVLVVGPWRSGTTVLHALLLAASGGTAPRTWQCMNAAAFRLGKAPASSARLVRPMDGIEVGADTPQEDEFALLTLGVPSAYRAFFMPHRLAELSATLDPAFWSAHPEWLEVWTDFLQGVWQTTPAAKAPLVLKSPNHSFRLPSILHRFPAARLIWMCRPAAELVHSNRKMWRAMFAAHGLTDPPGAAGLDGFLVHVLLRSADALDWSAAQLPRASMVALRHVDLLAGPEPLAEAAWLRVGAERPADRGALRRAADQARRSRAETYQAEDFEPQLAAAVARFDAAVGAALGSHGLR